MSLDFESSLEVARHYIGTPRALKRLGWGISGFVFLSPDLRTAVKVFRAEESYANELRAYRILEKRRVSRLLGLTIPRLRGWSDESHVLEIDTVSPPYLLDFAGCHFSPPDFEPHVWEYWNQQIHENYGRHAWVAHALHERLKRIGIYYLDFRPSNLNVTGLADDDITGT